MPEPRIRVVFLWHMHQPYYKDLVTGIYRLPWARLHALKDYYGMVAMLEEFPRIHQTFNLVPSLLVQLEDYASGEAREPTQEIAFTSTEELSIEQRLFILKYFFQANLEHLISRYSRYRELYDRMQANEFIPGKGLPFFRDNDFTDLQVLSQLAWCDEIFLTCDSDLRALVSKGQGYSYADQQLLQRKQREAMRKVIQAYKDAAERGQIEISTSPFYHPILPLVCDTNVATEAHAGVRLPNRRFRHPEDSRLHLERAIALHQEVFGRTPRGLWPSEGSVSEEVLEICASLGFRWVATDQQILSNSTGVPFFYDGSGVLANADRLYNSYKFSTPSGEIRMLFRDHEISDRIGFVYSHMDPESAARDLVSRIKQSAWPVLSRGDSVLVSIILDGENAWEYYPSNGRPFLRAAYKLLSEDAQMECLTVSEALERHGPAQTLSQVSAGSWINGNFDIWIGADEDNRAWEYLSEARELFEERHKHVSPEKSDLAREELLVAEGSDWCWWYGPEHSTANDADFDALYRSHLANVYHALDQRPPDSLGRPIASLHPRVISSLPSNPVSPHIDGFITSYFEWMGAGFYSPVQTEAAMHGSTAILREAYFGRDARNYFLRLDFHDHARTKIGKLKFRVIFQPKQSHALTVTFFQPEPTEQIVCQIYGQEEVVPLPSLLAEAVLNKIFEMRVSLSAIELDPTQAFDFQVIVWENDYPCETFPITGWFSVPALNSTQNF